MLALLVNCKKTQLGGGSRKKLSLNRKVHIRHARWEAIVQERNGKKRRRSFSVGISGNTAYNAQKCEKKKKGKGTECSLSRRNRLTKNNRGRETGFIVEGGGATRGGSAEGEKGDRRHQEGFNVPLRRKHEREKEAQPGSKISQRTSVARGGGRRAKVNSLALIEKIGKRGI